MGKLWAVTKREYVERVRTKWFVIGTVLGPLLFSAMLFGPAWLSMRGRAGADVSRITILDASGTGLGRQVREALAEDPRPPAPATRAGPPQATPAAPSVRLVTLKASELPAAESLATAQVMRGEMRGYLVLTPATVRGDSARYAGKNASSIRDTERLRAVVRQAVLAARLKEAGLDAARVAAITGSPVVLNTQAITDRGRGASGIGTVVFAAAVSLLLYVTIVLYGQNVLRSVVEEKTTRVAEVIVSSISPEKLLAGKVLGVGAVGLTQQVVWIGGTVYMSALLTPALMRAATVASQAAGGGPASASGFTMPDVSLGTIGALLLFFLFGYAFYSSLFAAVGATVNSETEAQQATAPILTMLVATSFLIQPVVFNPSSGLARVMSLVPLSSPVIMPLRMGLGDVPPWEVVASLAILALACWAGIWVSARIYRTGLLMYGKRPTLREIMRWAAQAG